jgi:hypothetical protein
MVWSRSVLLSSCLAFSWSSPPAAVGSSIIPSTEEQKIFECLYVQNEVPSGSHGSPDALRHDTFGIYTVAVVWQDLDSV